MPITIEINTPQCLHAIKVVCQAYRYCIMWFSQAKISDRAQKVALQLQEIHSN